MAKSKRISRAVILPTRDIPRAFVDELLYCTDGVELARKHLALGPVALMLGVTTIFGGLATALEMGCFVEAIPSPPTLDYLEQALKILGKRLENHNIQLQPLYHLSDWHHTRWRHGFFRDEQCHSQFCDNIPI